MPLSRHAECRHRDFRLTGRFLRRDPAGFSGGINLYAFCGNDPIDFADPSGLIPVWMQKAGAGIQAFLQRPIDPEHPEDGTMGSVLCWIAIQDGYSGVFTGYGIGGAGAQVEEGASAPANSTGAGCQAIRAATIASEAAAESSTPAAVQGETQAAALCNLVRSAGGKLAVSRGQIDLSDLTALSDLGQYSSLIVNEDYSFLLRYGRTNASDNPAVQLQR